MKRTKPKWGWAKWWAETSEKQKREREEKRMQTLVMRRMQWGCMSQTNSKHTSHEGYQDTRLFLPYLCCAEKPYPVWQLWQFRHAPIGNSLGKAVLRWLQSFSLAARLGEWAVSRLFKTHHLKNCIWLGSFGKAFENTPDPFTREHNKDLLTFLSKAANLHSSEWFFFFLN